ncbi:response regulator [Candidatus Wolfebacteria bacterium]|nr:response regulator [Candidatus Wolfebacteria bacterium]
MDSHKLTHKDKKILVVEDEKPMRRVLADSLIAEGFSVLEAENGIIGLDVAMREHPDLILLDLLMPQMDGIEMLKKLREDAWGKNAIVIVLTNLGDTEKIVEATKCGAYGYLLKTNWRMDEVIRKIEGCLCQK